MSGEPRTYANTACPYCSLELDPLPKAKKRCPGCGQPIYPRTGPDGLTYLLQAGDRPALDRAWAEYREARDYRAKVAALGVDFNSHEAEMHRQDARYSAHDVWWSAVNDAILAAVARADWFAAQAGYFAHARDLADHGQPWSDVARAGFKMELQQLLGVVESTDIFACTCRVCELDAGRRLLVAAEIAAPTLPHVECEKGWCGCDYLPSFDE